MEEMLDLLEQIVGLLASSPMLAAGVGAVVVLALLAWGVVSTSYRYR